MQHIDNWQVVALANFEVYRVVSRRNFQNASAELRINCYISNDGNFLTRKRAPGVFTQKTNIPFVAWGKSHRSIGHDRFRSRGCDFEKTTRLFHDLVSNKIEVAFLRFGNDFFI